MSGRPHTTYDVFSSACPWAARSIRSPVRFEPKQRPAPGSRRKRLSAGRWRARRNAAGHYFAPRSSAGNASISSLRAPQGEPQALEKETPPNAGGGSQVGQWAGRGWGKGCPQQLNYPDSRKLGCDAYHNCGNYFGQRKKNPADARRGTEV